MQIIKKIFEKHKKYIFTQGQLHHVSLTNSTKTSVNDCTTITLQLHGFEL